MNTSLRHIALTALALLLTSAPTPQAQVEWTHHPASPVLQALGETDWDLSGVLTPTVIADGDTLKMWYAGGDDLDNSGLTHTNIGYAWSLDGVTWTRHDDPVLTPEGADFVSHPRVLADGDVLHMWYGEGSAISWVLSVRYATSTDGGVTWNRHPGPVLTPSPGVAWNRSGVWPGGVIKEGGLFKMWYSACGFSGGGRENACNIGLATSPDGVVWTLYDDPATTEPPFHLSDPVLVGGPNGAFDAHEATTSSVRRTDAGYEMWYFADPNVVFCCPRVPPAFGYATSPDGITWTKYEGNPVLTIGEAADWASEIGYSNVLFFDGQYHMWYTGLGLTFDFFSQIGYATAPITVAAEPGAAPSEVLALNAPYPNPTAAGTTLGYRLAQPAHITLTVHDLLGREVAQLVDEVRAAGEHMATWDGRADGGRRVSAGVYVVRLQTGDAVQSRKVLLLR